MNNESGCFSIQMNEYQPKLIICSSPLITNRTSSTKQTVGLSFKAKLKSKIFISCKKRSNKLDSFTSFTLYEKISQPNGNIVATFCKIMDKSLGWFKNKSKNKRLNRAKSKQVPKRKTEQFNPYEQDEFSQLDESLYLSQNACSTFGTQLISTPIKINKPFLQPMSSPINKSTNSFLHSTPLTTFTSEHIYSSPICCVLNSSYQSNSTASSCYSSKSFTRTRLAFGMTSSPNTTVNDDEKQEINESSILANNGLIETQSNEFSCLDSKEKLLVEHLNFIKENVRIGVELRDLKSNVSKRNHLDIERDDTESSMTNKKRKLQNIFQSKLQQQIKEVKKWQSNFKTKLNLRNNLSTSTKCSIHNNCSCSKSLVFKQPFVNCDLDNNFNCQCYSCQNANFNYYNRPDYF